MSDSVSDRVRTPSTALSVLFGVCLLGVVLMGGALVAVLAGLLVLALYAAGVVAVLVLAVLKVRRLVAAAAPPPRPVCGCCDGDHSKPIEVV